MNLRVQASENAIYELDNKQRASTTEKKCYSQTPLYTVNVDGRCMASRLRSHLLNACNKFRSLSREPMMTILKQHGFCLKCLKSSHLLRQSPSFHRCQKCQRPHDTWLHLDKQANLDKKANFDKEAILERQTNSSPSLSENTPGHIPHVRIK